MRGFLVAFGGAFLLSHVLVLAADATRPCSDPLEQVKPYCNHTISIDDRVSDLLKRLSVSDKINMVQNSASATTGDTPIPSYQWWSEALHGVAKSPGVNFDGELKAATSFPQVIGTAASFNRELWRNISATISTEARAFNNAGQAGLTFWAPNLNIFRDPRWGRGQETPGEDPLLSSEYVYQYVKGMQEGLDGDAKSPYLKVSSCCKHYAAYSLENWGGVDRHHFNAQVGVQDMADTYLPAFRSCVARAGATSVMCSYNEVNGVPSCASERLLTDIVRGDWGFDGYVTGDCGAVEDLFTTHKYTNTTDATCAAVMQAGLDTDCGDFLPQHLAAAVASKAVSQAVLDGAVGRLARVQMRLGWFDPPELQPYMKLGASDVDTTEARALALRAAHQGATLLKNGQDALPLAAANVKTLAVIGPLANDSAVLQGNYYGVAPYLVTVAQGLSKYAAVALVEGCDVAGNSTAGFDAAKKAAAAADATVLVLGLTQSQEAEGHDRTSLLLPGVQDQLAAAVAAASKGPVVVVLLNGGPLDVTALRDSKDVDAMLWAGYPGQDGGTAVADILFGTVSPSGRLPVTWYPEQFATATSMFDMSLRPSSPAKPATPGRTHRFYTSDAVFPFGFGMSYTSYSFQLQVSAAVTQSTKDSVPTIALADLQSMLDTDPTQPAPVVLKVNAKNVGTVIGGSVVLVNLRGPNAGQNGASLRDLAGFERVELEPGNSQVVDIPLTVSQFAVADSTGKLVGQQGAWVAQVSSADVEVLMVT